MAGATKCARAKRELVHWCDASSHSIINSYYPIIFWSGKTLQNQVSARPNCNESFFNATVVGRKPGFSARDAAKLTAAPDSDSSSCSLTSDCTSGGSLSLGNTSTLHTSLRESSSRVNVRNEPTEADDALHTSHRSLV